MSETRNKGDVAMVDLFRTNIINHSSLTQTTPRQSIRVTVSTRILKDIHEQTGVEYRDMLFFDDEKDNIKTVRRLGVTCIKLSKETGLTFADVNSGLKQYREACLSRSSLRQWFTPLEPKKDDQDTNESGH